MKQSRSRDVKVHRADPHHLRATGEPSEAQLGADLGLSLAPRLMSVGEVRELLGLRNNRAVYRLRDSGALRGIMVSSRALRFAPIDVMRLLQDGLDAEWSP